MKKLGLIFVVFLSLGVFFAPNNVSAKATEEDRKAIVSNAVDKLNTIPNRLKGTTFENLINDTEGGLVGISYSSFADQNINKENTLATEMEAYVLNKFIDDVLRPLTRQQENTLSVAFDTNKATMANAMIAILAPIATKANEDSKVKLGLQTQENADRNSLQSATNYGKITTSINKEMSKSCGNILTDFWCNVNQGLVNFIKIFLLNIAGFLLWASANMLNYSIKVGILDFARWAPDALYPIWIVVRQIVSLFVVFAGLYLGLMYIIGKDEKFEKYIPWVVIFALFVNFSYPLARTAIDVSNIVSLNIYTGAVGESVLTGDQKNTAGAIIMQRLGLEKLVLSATENKASTDMVTGISSPAGALMVIIFVLFSAYIFFMVTWLIIARTAVLIFLTIASPILFIDSVIPKLGDVAMTLRKTFLEQLFVGPVFMIMLALTLKFLEVFNLTKTSSSGSGTFDTTIVEFFNITMMLIMLHIMRKVTMSTAGGIGATVSGYMGKVGGFAVGGAAGLAMGGAGFLARQTIGRHASKLANSDWMNTQAGKTGVGGFVGRRMMGMTESIAKSSFDARNSSYVQAGGAKLGLSGGMGTGTKMSFDQVEEQRKKNLEKHFSRVGTYKDNQYRRDESGNLVLEKKKGEVIDSDEAREARKEYIKNATGSSIFTTEQERLDTEHKLQKSDGKINQTDEEKEKEKRVLAQAQIDSTKALAESNKQLAEAMSSRQTTTPPQVTAPQTEKPPVTDFATMFTS